MKRLIKQMSGSSKGFSLTEVLIAIVILGVAGATIINGMTTDTKVRGKTNTATNVSVNLDTAAQYLMSPNVEFIANCDGNTKDTYQNKLNSNRITVTSVDTLPPSTKSPVFEKCTSIRSFVATVVQRITLQSTNAGTTLTRIILKTNTKFSSAPATPFSISASKSNVTVVAPTGASNCGTRDTISLNNSLGSSSVIYSVIGNTNPNILKPQQPLESTLPITGNLQGTTTLTLQGINPDNGVLSSTVTIIASVLESLNVAPQATQISVASPYGRIISGAIFVKGGSAYTKTVTSTSSDPNFTITSSNYSVNAKSISVPDTYSYSFNIIDTGLNNISGCTPAAGTISIAVQPSLAFRLNSYNKDTNPTGIKCIVGNAYSCPIPVLFTPGTGSGQTISNGLLNTYTSTPSPTLSINATLCTSVTDNKAFGKLTSTSASVVKLILNGSFPQFDKSKAKSVNLYYGNSGLSLNNWDISSYTETLNGKNVTATLILSGGSSTISWSTETPTGIEIAILNSIYPQLTDSNFSSSYTSTSLTLLDQYCNG